MDEYKALIIGSLLHDIGKLVQRAYNDTSKKHDVIGKEFLAGTYKKGEEKISIGEIFNLNEEEKEVILTLVGEHHNKDYKGKYKDLVNIVKLADWLSSGERVEAKDK
ncbi:HD domain-containing protein, partial [Methanocaldococcus infernus]